MMSTTGNSPVFDILPDTDGPEYTQQTVPDGESHSMVDDGKRSNWSNWHELVCTYNDQKKKKKKKNSNQAKYAFAAG